MVQKLPRWVLGKAPARVLLRLWAAPLFALLGIITATLLLSFASTPVNAQSSGSTFTVDSTADDADVKSGDGRCATATGSCTLRAAITEANRHSGPDTITFNISGTDVQTIQLTKSLPDLNDLSGPTTIDGYTQPGASPNNDPLVSNAAIKVEIKGIGHDNTQGAFNGLTLASPDNVVRGLALYSFYKPIRLIRSNAYGNYITGNFIGTDARGTYTAPAFINYANGIHVSAEAVSGGPANNTIGGSSPADRNVISGNADKGIGFYNGGTNSNKIMGNLIGLDPTGLKRLSNKSHGIDINTGASFNIIGGVSPGERNVISGNQGEGIEVSHGSTTTGFPDGNQIIGNFIGTDVTGEQAPNYSFNAQMGVNLQDTVNDNVIRDNVIGNNRAGGITIGGSRTMRNQVYRNHIGISRGGLAVPNGVAGVRIIAAKNSKVGPDNVIANNPIGIVVDYADADFNTITRNSIYSNTGLGIDIQPINKVNVNDATDGDSQANEQLNYPVLTRHEQTTVAGMACADCTVEVFKADGGASAYGEGMEFVGSAVAGRDGVFTGSVTGVNVGDYITTTATDTQGNTSEFSPNFVVDRDTGDEAAPTITITTPEDNATYSLNEDVRASYSCEDEAGGSGLKSCVGDVPNGARINTSTAGIKAFKVTTEDNAGNATSVTHSYTIVDPSATVYVEDGFDRTVTDGWGSADTGGTYSLSGSTGDFDVNGSTGTIALPSAPSGRTALLRSVSAQDVEGTFRVSTDKAATGDGQQLYFIGRYVSPSDQYRGRLRFTPSGGVTLQALKLSGGTQTWLGSQVVVPGLKHAADKAFRVRVQISGTNPTTIRMKVWEDGQAEPTNWQYNVTDSQASLQTSGAVGLNPYIPGNSTNAPVVFSFDDLRVTSSG